jgi:hypothetical protein
MNEEHEHPTIDIEEGNNLPQLQTPVMEPGSRSTCGVVSAFSPDNICLRRLDEEESFYQMYEGLTTYRRLIVHQSCSGIVRRETAVF